MGKKEKTPSLAPPAVEKQQPETLRLATPGKPDYDADLEKRINDLIAATEKGGIPMFVSKRLEETARYAGISDEEIEKSNPEELIAKMKMRQEEGFKQSPEMAEIKKEINAMSREEKMGLMRGIASAGFYAQKGKSAFFAGLFEKLGGKSESQKKMARFMSGLAETYRHDEKIADKRLNDVRKRKIQGWSKWLHGGASAGYLAGNLAKYGRTIGDLVGWTAAMPVRYAMMISMGVARLAEAGKEAHFKSEIVMDKTRIQDAKIAAEEAWNIYSKAKEQNGDKEVLYEDLEIAYATNLPQDILNRLQKETFAEKVNLASAMIRKVAQLNIEHSASKIREKFAAISAEKSLNKSEKAAAEKKIVAKYEKGLRDWDRSVGQYGTVDAFAMGARYLELAGKSVVAIAAVDTIIENTIHNIAHLLSHSDLSHTAEISAAAHSSDQPTEAPQEIPRGLTVPIPGAAVNPESAAVIPEHGSVWGAARSLGLNEKEFSAAWVNPESVAHTPSGAMKIADAGLVHKGDVVNYIPGKNGGTGRFEVIPKSGQPIGASIFPEHVSPAPPQPLEMSAPKNDPEQQFVQDVFGQPITGHENIMGYPDHPPKIPTTPLHPAGNPIIEVGNAPLEPMHPAMLHEVAGSITMHPGGTEINFDVRGYNGTEYVSKNYRNDILAYALSHRRDQQNELDKFQNLGLKLTSSIKYYEKISADPARADQTKAALSFIKKIIDQIEKTYGDGFIDKTKLAEFLK